ncbi:hypothetical protein D3C80_1634390 [compost metagenome]
MQIQGHVAGDGADIDQMATAVQAVHGVDQTFRRRARAQCVYHHIDAFAVGDAIGPILGGTVTQGMDLDAPGRGQVLDPLEQRLVTRGAENLARAQRQGQGNGTQTESAADAVDQHGAAGADIGRA